MREPGGPCRHRGLPPWGGAGEKEEAVLCAGVCDVCHEVGIYSHMSEFGTLGGVKKSSGQGIIAPEKGAIACAGKFERELSAAWSAAEYGGVGGATVGQGGDGGGKGEGNIGGAAITVVVVGGPGDCPRMRVHGIVQAC